LLQRTDSLRRPQGDGYSQIRLEGHSRSAPKSSRAQKDAAERVPSTPQINPDFGPKKNLKKNLK
jgi:hypothetical protein